MLERRAAAAADEDFLRDLFASAHPELALLGDAIIDLQVRAQRREWEDAYPGSADELILLDGQPVGRVWVAWLLDSCLLVDMALLPEHRRTGIGTQIVGDVLAEADRRGVPARVTVERGNAPSLAFCDRHGFAEVGGDAVYVELERPVNPARPPPASG